jgi:hypothetical protein
MDSILPIVHYTFAGFPPEAEDHQYVGKAQTQEVNPLDDPMFR